MSTSHSNVVTLTSSGITLVSAVWNGISVVTSGQPYTPPVASAAIDNGFSLTIECGRSKSEAVATSFNSVVLGLDTGGTASKHEYAPVGGGGSPDELNFYFGAVLTFQVDSHQVPVLVYLGQGSFGTTNNWWIGSPSLINNGSGTYLGLISGSSLMELLAVSGGTSSFEFKPA